MEITLLRYMEEYIAEPYNLRLSDPRAMFQCHDLLTGYLLSGLGAFDAFNNIRIR